jgi:hypothetical protein
MTGHGEPAEPLPEPFDSPFVLRFSKDERWLKTGLSKTKQPV